MVFVTDGDPTARNSFERTETGLVAGEALALTKAAHRGRRRSRTPQGVGSHVFVVGVGAAVTDDISARRLTAVSGPDEYVDLSDNLRTADFTRVKEFADLEQALQDIAERALPVLGHDHQAGRPRATATATSQIRAGSSPRPSRPTPRASPGSRRSRGVRRRTSARRPLDPPAWPSSSGGPTIERRRARFRSRRPCSRTMRSSRRSAKRTLWDGPPCARSGAHDRPPSRQACSGPRSGPRARSATDASPARPSPPTRLRLPAPPPPTPFPGHTPARRSRRRRPRPPASDSASPSR